MARHGKMSVRAHPTQSLGSGMMGTNELSSSHLPHVVKQRESSEINTVSDFSASGRRAVINSPGAPYGGSARRRKRRK